MAETLFVVVIVVLLSTWTYGIGKSFGGRKAYGLKYRYGRRWR